MIHTNLIADEIPGRYRLLVTDEFSTDIHSVDTLGVKIKFNLINGDEIFNSMADVIIKVVLNKLIEVSVGHQSDSFLKIWQTLREHHKEGVPIESPNLNTLTQH
jgi:hypothetical protein